MNTFVPHFPQSTIVSDFLGSEAFAVTLLQSDTNRATFIPPRWAASGFPILLGDCQIFVPREGQKADEIFSRVRFLFA